MRRICVETSSRNLEKREQKWVVALTPEQCKHLNDSAKSELRTMLGFSGNEMQVSDDGSSDTDNRSSSNDSKDSESNSDGGADDSDVNEQCQEEESGVVCDSHSGTAMDVYDSSSSEDTGPYWNTLEFAP